MTRKPSYSSFFSVLCPDSKKIFFGKNHWAPSEVLEVKRPFSRSRRPNFGFHLFLISFHLEVLSFEVIWPRRPRLREFFQKLQFWNQCIPTKKMRYICHSFLVKLFPKSFHRGGVNFDLTSPQHVRAFEKSVCLMSYVLMSVRLWNFKDF